MADEGTKQSGEIENLEGGPFTLLTIPDDQVEAVMEFVASRQPDPSDVSGHMFTRATGGSFGFGRLSATYETASNCKMTTQKGGGGVDERCTDTDKISGV